jgi:two-component system response regulator MprA
MADHRPLETATRVLCVGPDAYLTDLLRYALGREGYAVRVAASGAEAIEAAGRWRPHAAIVDGDLVDLGGEDLAAQLRGRHDVAAILLSAGAEWGTRGDLAHGPGRRLAKPVRLGALLVTLEGLLQPAAAGR